MIFALEALVKVIALGPRSYFATRVHWFELTIVVASIVTAALSIGRVGNLIRLLRVLNILRFVKVSPSLQVHALHF